MAGEAPETPELSQHDAAMVAKVDAAHAASTPAVPASQAPAAAVRPEGIPEKFWDAEKGVVKVEDLAKSYAELERSRAAPDASKGVPDAVTAAAKAGEDAAKAAGVDTKSLDFDALAASFAANGALTDADYASLKAQGITKELADAHIVNAQRVAALESQLAVSEVHALVGGADKYSAMLQWAGVNLTAAEQSAFDTAVVGTPESRQMAINSLKSRHRAALGSDPKLVTGDGRSAASSAAFQSRAEVTAAMRDPRYKADPAYRADVERRVGAMSVF